MNGSARSQSNDTVPAFLFDLDGTLINSLYQHVLTWREALVIGRRVADRSNVGMSGGITSHKPTSGPE